MCIPYRLSIKTIDLLLALMYRVLKTEVRHKSVALTNRMTCYLIFTNTGDFQSLEGVNRGSETQLQVINKIGKEYRNCSNGNERML